MGRYTGPVCRLCRREGVKLFLKTLRCDSPKCALEKRGEQAPGMHTQKRRKTSDYGARLREKQKVKRYFGVYDKQFRRYMDLASRSKGNTGSTLMTLLERRPDNIVHRLGFAGSRRTARQLVVHGHICVNGRKVTVPSLLVRAGDTVSVKARPKSLRFVKQSLEAFSGRLPDFLAVDSAGDSPSGRVLRLPGETDWSLPVQTALIIEFLSR
ncbi:MAG: 30S ribosomal protein S4 [Planctomycetota bacterium]|nr:30S ribosomal protein S4 [Planctomycetota bacterium]